MSKQSRQSSLARPTAVRTALIILFIALLAWAMPVQQVDPNQSAALASELSVPDISGEAAIVLDGHNGDILYEKNSHAHYAPASITKIATAIVALDQKGDQLDERIPIDFDSYEIVLDSNGTVMGLKPGDNPTLRDLLYGLMLPSGNDAAIAIARYVGSGGEMPDLPSGSTGAQDPSAGSSSTQDLTPQPSEGRFIDMMNQKMHDLGLNDSHFVNPHGLDAKGHYSSAYDMAALTYYGMQNPTFRQLADAVRYQVTGTRSYEVWNLNRLLYNYDGADGVKIGYTENALETIVASATRGPFKLIAAVMYSNNRYGDARLLMDYYFDVLAKGNVTRVPLPTPMPTPTAMPTATPIPLDSSPVLEPVSTASSPVPTPNPDIWSGLGDILRAIGIGR